MTKNTKSFALPLAFIGVMFFSLGFALGINSVLVPVLKGSLEISSLPLLSFHFLSLVIRQDLQLKRLDTNGQWSFHSLCLP